MRAEFIIAVLVYLIIVLLFINAFRTFLSQQKNLHAAKFFYFFSASLNIAEPIFRPL